MRTLRQPPVQVVRGTAADDGTWTDLDDDVPIGVDSRAFLAVVDLAAFCTLSGAETGDGDYAKGLHFSVVGMRASDGTVTVDETEQTLVGSGPVAVVLKAKVVAVTGGVKLQIKADTIATGSLAVTAAADVRVRMS